MAIIAMIAMLATVTMKPMKAMKAMIAVKAMKTLNTMIVMKRKAMMGIGKSDSILIPGSRELMENSWAVAWLDSKSR